jgi:hypothetical protein
MGKKSKDKKKKDKKHKRQDKGIPLNEPEEPPTKEALENQIQD